MLELYKAWIVEMVTNIDNEDYLRKIYSILDAYMKKTGA